MGRKDGSTLRGRQKGLQTPSRPSHKGRKSVSDLTPAGQVRYQGVSAQQLKKAVERGDKSWAALGADTSMTACSVVGVGYDAVLDKTVGPGYAEIRWQPEDDYFKRLAEACNGFNLVLDVLREFWVMNPNRVYLAIEEPFFYGAVKTAQSGWLKQQAEVAGAFKGGLARYGFLNIREINNSQWHKTLRDDGVEFEVAKKGTSAKERAAIRYRNKFLVKTWAIQAFGLPDLPDLVASKTGAKIIRPESGFGAKAKPVQPNDIYDAAACAAWMQDMIESGQV